ncbi:MAG: sodium/solute symporter [bacterium]|nr:sodium/solute symporter [bacterium]
MRTPDLIMFFGYLVVVLAIGFAVKRRDGSSSEFFLAGRSMPWFPVGLSVMVTLFSAVNYTAFPTEVFGHGLYVAIALPAFVLVAWPVTRIVIPFFHPMGLTSAYEYLERRFDVRVRRFASALFIFWRLLWMATALFASSRALAAVTGLDMRLLIVLGGLAATSYTAYGGMRAVIWTDVAQFFVLFGGIAASVAFVVAHHPGGLPELFASAFEGGRLQPVAPFDVSFFNPDPRIRITLWSGLIGASVAFMARYSADQIVVQRYFAARSVRDAQRAFWCNIVAALLALSLLLLFGLTIHAHAVGSGTLGQEGMNPVKHMALLVRSLPFGICGLVAAGLLAATMSSIDSGVNACLAAYVTDIRPWFASTPAGENTRNRVLTLVLGVGITGLAFQVGKLGSLFVIANKIINGLGCPLLAIMILAMFSRRATSRGMLIGGIIGTAFSVFMTFGVKNLALHHYATVNLLGTLAACYVCSLIAGALGERSSGEQLSWMWRPRTGE